ncbi:uncharacterized protein LOC134015373 isoform X2 [Osmerus eperlanus]|uniref:uncharacterized protein LOC134015373 isoform X2 n=1 Tax=Osmerus eperlanus TaxID=29151 RepID=UPI002E138563
MRDPPSPVKKKTGCFKVNDCKCIMKDGTGVISLRTMGDEDGFLLRSKPVLGHSLGKENTEVLFSFSSCQPFTEPEDLAGTECTNIAACLIVRFRIWNNRYITRYVDYGRHEGDEFHYNDSMKTLSVSYFALANNKQPQTIVHYHCSPNHTTSFVQDFSIDIPLQIWVESACACPNACAISDLGPGTIFLIILSLSAAAYLILGKGTRVDTEPTWPSSSPAHVSACSLLPSAGSCALRPFRTSSSGVQIAPEDNTWCMLCYLFAERKGGKPRRRYYSFREDKL